MINGINVEIRDNGEVLLSSKLFDLCVHKGTGVNNTSFVDLRVNPKGPARDWGVNVEINRVSPVFNGGYIECECASTYVTYAIPGNRYHMDINEFIHCLQEAVNFKKEVDDFLHLEGREYD